MLTAAKNLEFEKAADLRDRVKKLEEMELALRWNWLRLSFS